MFDHISFITHKLQLPITDRNHEYTVPFYYGDEKRVDDCIKNASFFLNGTIEQCPIHPISEKAKKMLFYIEVFAVLNTSKNYFTERYFFDSYLLLYTYKGQGNLTYKGKEYSVKEGEGFLIDCRIPHRYETSGNEWVHADLHFNGAFSEEIFREYSAAGDVTFSKPLSDSFQRNLETLIEVYDDSLPCRELQISNRLENILMSLLLDSQNYKKSVQALPEDLKYLVRDIQNNYMHALTLDFLADFSGFSKYNLIRIFHKYMDFSPQEYIIQLRIEKAKELLVSTNFPANKIGCIVGIPNPNYFGHLFKSRVGLSPGKYRKDYNTGGKTP
ncbi:MAG: AraC family transcriptional regulator [Eubacteriales bacterium]|nr:AraC family transcriptional regulator [Eubacteriales bacterium]